MRRSLKTLWNSLKRPIRNAEAGWDAFWFAPADPTLLGLIRILTGSMLLYTHFVWGLALDAFFGPDGWLHPSLVQAMQRDTFAWSYWWWIPSDWMWTAHYAAMAILALFTLGVQTRLTSILAFVVVVSYVHRVPCALFGLDQINAFLTLYCAIGPSGAALSVDRLLAVRRERRAAAAAGREFLPSTPASVGANVALRLIQVQMCVIYFFAGISKLQGTAWWTGDAMWLAFANLEYQSMDMTWLARHPWMIHLMTHVTIAWELTFWALIYRPIWRPVMLLGAIALHVGIGACLGMWTFGLVMLIGCCAFLPPTLVTQCVSAFGRVRLRRPSPVEQLAPDAAVPERWATLMPAVNAGEQPPG